MSRKRLRKATTHQSSIDERIQASKDEQSMWYKFYFELLLLGSIFHLPAIVLRLNDFHKHALRKASHSSHEGPVSHQFRTGATDSSLAVHLALRLLEQHLIGWLRVVALAQSQRPPTPHCWSKNYVRSDNDRWWPKLAKFSIKHLILWHHALQCNKIDVALLRCRRWCSPTDPWRGQSVLDDRQATAERHVRQQQDVDFINNVIIYGGRACINSYIVWFLFTISHASLWNFRLTPFEVVMSLHSLVACIDLVCLWWSRNNNDVLLIL